MTAPDTLRYVKPAPSGVLTWLAQAAPSLKRRLFEHLLLAGRPQALEMPALAQALGRPISEIAQALFALNREKDLQVLDAPPADRDAWAATGLAGLDKDLLAMTAPGQYMLLSSLDGFCIAQVGLSRYEAEVLAARRLPDRPSDQRDVVPLHFAAAGFYISSNARLDAGKPALLRMGYRLLHACGSIVDKE